MPSRVPDVATLATIASLIAGFGIAMLFFRIQREIEMNNRSERIWIPTADWLLVAATVICLAMVLLPLVSGFFESRTAARVAAASCSGSILLVVGYVFAILAHYRLILGFGRSGPRDNPEPSERVLVMVTCVASISLSTWVFLSLRAAV